MTRVLAALAVVAGLTLGPSAASVSADAVSYQQTTNICHYIEGAFDEYPGGYWIFYHGRTVHLFGGSIHVTQCAYKDYLNRPVWWCYQLAWNLPPGQTSSIEKYPSNNADPASPCW